MTLFTLACLALACGASVPEHATPDGFLHMPVSRRTLPRANERDMAAFLQRRDSDSLDTELLNNQSFYSIDFELGTPPQALSLLLDTGSSDVWVLDESACRALGRDCTHSSTFDSNSSSSFHNNHTSFFQQYADSTMAEGEWAQDVMRLGNVNVSNFNFAVAEQTNSTQGTAGIGLAVGETPYILQKIREPYSNLPMQLKEQGTIQRVAYSLWLNRNGANAGSILFGALDHAKIASDLYKLPFVATEGVPIVTRFAVMLTGLSAYNSGGSEQPFASCATGAVLDSGSTVSSIPEELILPFYEAIGAEQIAEGYYVVECSALSSRDGGLGLQFGGLDVTIGFDDLLVPITKSRLTGTTYCVPGFLVSPDLAIIGDNILRTLYVVYDLENLEVGIAAAETNSRAASSSSLEVISTGIPGARDANNTNTQVNTAYATTQVTVFASHASSFSVSVSGGEVTSIAVPPGPRATSRGGPFGDLFGGNSATVPSSVSATAVIGAKNPSNRDASSNPSSSSGSNSASRSGSNSASSSSGSSKSKNGATVAGAAGSFMATLAALVVYLV